MGNQSTYTRSSGAALSRDRGNQGLLENVTYALLSLRNQNHGSGLERLMKRRHLWDTLVDIHGLPMDEMYAVIANRDTS